MKSVAFHNLGCKVNSYEMDVMQQNFREKGYEIVPFDEMADIYIVNTCTVTNIADRKSRQMLHRAKEKNPQALVVAVGCYVQTAEARVESDASVDLAVGNNRKRDIAEIVERFLEERQQAYESGRKAGEELTCFSDKTLGGSTVIDINHTDEYEEMTLKKTAEHTRAYIKIQDGCNQFCSYCAIPLARGRVRSRSEEHILKEVQGLAAEGYREIVLTGIHISSYGIDFDGRKAYTGAGRLIDLVELIHREVPKLDRIRLGSLEPRVITKETAGRLAELPKLCPHFHLSMQSGCEETLKRMNRHYTPVEYLQGVQFLREAFEHPAITTDVIVGFPGETEEEFAQTEDFIRQVGFYELHIFKYSRRDGTRAARMSHQVTEAVKAQRSDRLFVLEQEQSRSFRGYYIGKSAEVLWESEKEIGGSLYRIGHTRDYVKVALPVGEGPRSGEEPYSGEGPHSGEGLYSGEKPRSGDLTTVAVEGFLTDEILLGRDFR